MTATGIFKVDGQTISSSLVMPGEITITKRLNAHSRLSFSLLDVEGSLYATDIGGGTNWGDASGLKVTFQHSDGTYQFIGKIDSLQFLSDRVNISCSGMSIKAREYVLSTEEANFIINSGHVNGDPIDYQGVACAYDDANDVEQDFEWESNEFLWVDNDVGVVFTRSGAEEEVTWVPSAVTPADHDSAVGDVTDAQVLDGDSYAVYDTSNPLDASVVIACVDTVNKVASANDLHQIAVNIRGGVYADLTGTTCTITLQVYNWDTASYVDIGSWTRIGTVGWPSDNPINTTTNLPEPLEDYLTDSGAAGGDYDKIQFRAVFSGPRTVGGTAAFFLNYIGVTIKSTTFVYSPITARVYGNDATRLYLSDGIYEETTGFTNTGTTFDFYRGHASGYLLAAVNEKVEKTDLNQANGETVEWWMLVDNTATSFQVSFTDTDNDDICTLQNSGGNFQFTSGSGNTDCGAITANQWHHCKISHNGSTLKKVWCYIDGVLKVDEDDVIATGTAAFKEFEIRDLSAANLYVDAIGMVIYDAGNYTAGDNLVPTGGVASYTAGIRDTDTFITGQSTRFVLTNVFSKCLDLGVDSDPNFDRYYPRYAIGKSVQEVLESICTLENASWYEEYDTDGNCTIGVRKNTAFDESDYKTATHEITTANYLWDFEIECEDNHYKGVRVFGNPAFGGTEQYVEDSTSTSDKIFTIVDDSICYEGDAYRVAYEKLQTLKAIQPSIHLVVEDAYIQLLDVGKTVEFTCARPTLTGTYPIREIIYHYSFPLGRVYAEVFLGLGQSPPTEKLANHVEKSIKLARKIQTDKLNPSNVIGTPAFSHTSLSNCNGAGASGYHISAAQYAALGSGGKGIAAIPIWGDSNTPLGPSYVVLTDTGSHNDYVYGRFYLDPDVVDTSADITIIWVLNCDDADAAVTIKKYVGSIKTDNSEDYAFNIDNGSADSFDSTNAVKVTSKQWTIANAGIADDDMLIVALGVNETGRIIIAFGCWAVYTKV